MADNTVKRPSKPPVVDEDLELTATTPAAVVETAEEKTLQEQETGALSEEGQRELSPREEIYASHTRNHRPVTEPEPEEPVEEEPVALAEGEEEQPEENEIPEGKEEITVNGITRLVDSAKVAKAGGKEAYQQMVASQERFRQTAERNKELDVRERELLEREKALTQREESRAGAQPTDLAPVEDRDTEEQVKGALTDLLDDADVESAAKVITGLVKPSAPPVDARQVAEEVVTQTLQHQRREENERQYQAEVRSLQTAKREFAIEFPEIMGDPELFREADDVSDDLSKQHPDWNYSKILSEAGRIVSERHNEQSQPSEPTSIEKKAAEKRELRQPKGGSGRSQRKPEPKQPTRSDYVLELKRRRGQA